MAQQTTTGRGSAIRGAANNHRTTADSIDKQRTSANDVVEGLKSSNWGDLMNKLDALQDQWSLDINDVIKRLNEMAVYMDDVAKKLDAQDSAGAGELR